MRLDEAINLSIGQGLRIWRTSERQDGSTANRARMFHIRGAAHRYNVQWVAFSERCEWSSVGVVFTVADVLADDWDVDVGPVVNHPIQRLARSCNRHADCNAADDKAWPKQTDHCHDDDCEDCFGK